MAQQPSRDACPRQVHNSCFFEGARTLAAGTLVANPPYIPAPDDDILMPALHGGDDGANLTRVRSSATGRRRSFVY